MSNRVKILLAGGGVLLLLLLALYLKKTDPSTAGKTNAVQSIGEVLEDKTLRTKTAAYDAVANEKESFYNRPASAFKQAAAAPEPAASEAPTANVEAVKAQDRQFDEAYRQIEQDARSIYEQPSAEAEVPRQSVNASVKQPTPEPVTAEERRRRAMLQDWGMDKKEALPEQSAFQSAYRAVIHGTQLVKVGQTALFRTKESIQYGNLVVPANTLLSGLASVSENRLTIKINSVRIHNEVFALPLEVYGSDGIPGIPLNYDAVSKIANTQASNTATQEVGSAISSYGGVLGRVAGSLVSGVSSQVRSAKSLEVKLIDNQSLILKIVKQ